MPLPFRVALALVAVAALAGTSRPAYGQRAAGLVVHSEHVMAAAAKPGAEAMVRWWAGGAGRSGDMTGAAAGQPVLHERAGEMPESPPSWLDHWVRSLAIALQPARIADASPGHAALRLPVRAVELGGDSTTTVRAARDVGWDRLACTPAGTGVVRERVRLRADIVHAEPDGTTWVGLDLACIDAAAGTVRRVARAVVRNRADGRAQAAWAIVVVGGGVLDADARRGLADPDAAIVWPVRATVLTADDGVVRLGPFGWLAQVDRLPPRVVGPQALPGAGPDLAAAPAEPSARAALWFDASGAPRACLYDGTAGALPGRTPLPAEGIWSVPGDPGAPQLLLQRVARRTVLPEPVSPRPVVPTWAGYVGWTLDAAAGAQPVAIDLPARPSPGLWQCDVAASGSALLCHFAAAPGSLGAVEPELRLAWRPPRGFVPVDADGGPER